jgi:hypothetical protein
MSTSLPTNIAARARQIHEQIAVSVYGPQGSGAPECAAAWEVAVRLAVLEDRIEQVIASTNAIVITRER